MMILNEMTAIKVLREFGLNFSSKAERITFKKSLDSMFRTKILEVKDPHIAFFEAIKQLYSHPIADEYRGDKPFAYATRMRREEIELARKNFIYALQENNN